MSNKDELRKKLKSILESSGVNCDEFESKDLISQGTYAIEGIIAVFDAHIAAEVERAERRGRDAQILELVTGYDGLLRDLGQIKDGTKSTGVKASALITRLSALKERNATSHKEVSDE